MENITHETNRHFTAKTYRPAYQPNGKPNGKLLQERPFYYEMLVTILGNRYTKKKVIEKTKISISTMRRILLGEEVDLNYGNFRRLLYMYCFVTNDTYDRNFDRNL